jgi:hypothetical protein
VRTGVRHQASCPVDATFDKDRSAPAVVAGTLSDIGAPRVRKEADKLT